MWVELRGFLGQKEEGQLEVEAQQFEAVDDKAAEVLEGPPELVDKRHWVILDAPQGGGEVQCPYPFELVTDKDGDKGHAFFEVDEQGDWRQTTPGGTQQTEVKKNKTKNKKNRKKKK
eukprot:Trichotokara_eunicae@DN2209_c0_g1_i1.p1